MKKPSNKKKAQPSIKKAVQVKKTIAKQNKQKKQVKLIYPKWISPEHLSDKDRRNLKRFYELFSQGKYDVALSFASNLDTIVREQIPPDVWKQCGDSLTSKGEQELNKTKNGRQKNEPEAVEIKFNSLLELEQMVKINSKTLFGEHPMFFVDKKEIRDERFPDKFLIDFSSEKPKLFLVETALVDQSFGQYFVRITHFFAILKKKENQNDLVWKLQEIISSYKALENELQSRLPKDMEISEFLSSLLDNQPIVLLITNGEKSELPMLAETYKDTWGKMLKVFIIRKYAMENKEPYPVSASFTEITKSSRAKPEVVRQTEEDHLNACSETSRNIYKEIKTALLKADKSIEFNAKKIYISVRKNKNLAFFHLRKKISLVVMNPESDTRKHIKHHEIKSLPESVQKFWNGPSCTIVIENSANMAEIINLLKKMIAKV